MNEDFNIFKLIPQKPPIVMVDKVVYSDELKTVSSFIITEDNIFCEEGLFREEGLFENIAQTAAIRSGLEAEKVGKEPATGFIGAIKNAKVYNLPPIGSILNTEVETVFNFNNAVIINGFIKFNETLAAECEMKIFLNEQLNEK